MTFEETWLDKLLMHDCKSKYKLLNFNNIFYREQISEVNAPDGVEGKGAKRI